MASSENSSESILRRYRESAGLSQAELAEVVGLSRETIAVYESGTWPKQVKALLAIAERLGCTVGELVGERSSDEVVRLRAEVEELNDAIDLIVSAVPKRVRKSMERAAREEGASDAAP